MGAKAWRMTLCGLAILAAAVPAGAAVCAAGSVGSYVALGATGCTVGGLTFSDFVVDAFPGPTAQQIAPGSLSLAPIASGFMLSTRAGIVADAGDLFGFRLLFNVFGPSLTGGTVAFGPHRSATGDGPLTALLNVEDTANRSHRHLA